MRMDPLAIVPLANANETMSMSSKFSCIELESGEVQL